MDFLASNYHWSKREILYDTYFDELVELVPLANKRVVTEYKMQLAIAQNPHTKEPEELWRLLEQAEGKSGKKQMDETAVELLKSKLQQNPRFVVK